jgi:hypothetical protein
MLLLLLLLPIICVSRHIDTAYLVALPVRAASLTSTTRAEIAR